MAANLEGDRLLSRREVQKFLGLSYSKVYELTREGDLPARKVGGLVKYRLSDIVRWVDACPSAAKPVVQPSAEVVGEQ